MTDFKAVGSVQGYTTLDQTTQRDERSIKLISTSAAVTKGDVLVYDVADADEEITAHLADVSADDVALVCGVALQAGVAGDIIRYVHSGPAIVNIGNATVAGGEAAVFHGSTDGAADSANADATTVVFDTFGTMLSAEIGTTNTAIVNVRG